MVGGVLLWTLADDTAGAVDDIPRLSARGCRGCNLVVVSDSLPSIVH